MKTTNLRIPDNLHRALKESAETNHRSLNGEILRAIEFYLRLGSKVDYEGVVKLAKREVKTRK